MNHPKKYFLFLQGPHGPFFNQLSNQLVRSGARTHKIGFNAGDAFFWRKKTSFTAFSKPLDEWPTFFERFVVDNQVTDIVLYGDVRPIHKTAIEIAQNLGVQIHCFEEGYLRPYWATYERNGVNGHSVLMDMSIDDMQKAMFATKVPLKDVPTKWGDVRQHALLGAVYHWHILFRNKAFPHYQPHRQTTVKEEFRMHVKRLLSVSRTAVRRWRATRVIKEDGFAFHLALLQLGHDASIQSHSPFSCMSEFIDVVLEGFAKNAKPHHHLVFKSHPLEDFRVPIDKICQDKAKELGVADRVHFVLGGKLAELMDLSQSVLTVNSTAAQQALWRNLPLKSFGRSVYNKPELVSQQSLAEFFENPQSPDPEAYRTYRSFLLLTSQLLGSFYSRKGRNILMRLVVDRMLDEKGPYERLMAPEDIQRTKIRLVARNG